MSDEIFFDGQRFISAAEASSAADLTRDYVARLCRDGKVKGRRIGKNWYVHEDSLKHFLVEQSHAKEVRRGQLSNERTKEYFLAHRVTSPTSSDLQQVFPENVAEASTEHFIPIRRIVESDVREARATKSLASHAMHVQRALQTKALARGEGAVRFAPSMLATPSGVHEAVVRTLGHSGMYMPVHTLTPFAEFLQKFVALIVAFTMTFGTYALVDPSYARFAMDSIRGSTESISGAYVRVTGGGATALLERSREKMFFAAENPNAALAQVSGAALAFIPDTMRNIARAINSGIDDLVYAIAFPDSVTDSMALTPTDNASVSIDIAPYARGTQNSSSSATLVQAPAAQSSAPVAQNSNGAPVTIVERRVETERIVSAVGGITEDYLNQRLNTLESQITSRLLGVSSGGGGGYTTINNNYQMIAQSNNIDKLGSVAIDNSTFSGGTISGSAIENATITGTSFSGGSISATTLSASGASSFATTTISKLTVTGDTTLEGTLSIPGALSISSSTISLLTNTYATTSFISAVTASTTNLMWVNATGTNATTTNFFSTNASTTNATSTNLFATIGRFTSAIINAITTYGEVSAPSFSATSTTATSTFAGGILGTRVPTLSHTFGSWTIGASGANPFDASFVINPATAAGDTNLFAAAVGGSVKFLVDAEGDVFVNNLTSVGSVTLSTTTASTFTVEGNATFGDSISDITTVNGSLVVTGTTTASTVQGNFGVGTSTPWGRLSIAGVAGGTSPLFTISSSTSGYATSTVFHIDSNGRVGIGTSSPSAKFAVDAPIYVGGSGVTATSTFEGNVSIQGLLKVGTSSTYISNSDISAIGNLSVSNATTTNLFSTTASSTNLFSTSASFGSLSVLGALTQTGLGTFQNGFVSQASSTVVGAFTNTGAATFGSTLAASGLATLTSGFVSQASSTVVGAFTTTGTNTFGGALNITGAITSTASTTNTFPYASSTALTGTSIYSSTASTTNLTVSGIQSSLIVTSASGAASAYSGSTCTNQFVRSLNGAGIATCASIAAADLANADFGDFTVSSAVASLDADTVSDSEIDYATVTLADFTNDADYVKWASATSTLWKSAGLLSTASSTIGGGTQATGLTISGGATTTGNAYFAGNVGVGTTTPGNTLSLNVGSDGRGIVFGSGSTLLGSLIRYAFNGATGSLALESGASNRPVALNYASAANVLLANGGGNVGVGTTSPYSKLTAWGTDSLFEAVTSSSSTVFSIGQNGATSTNFFSTTASSTNLFSTSATFGSLSVLGALSQTGLGTFTNGFVSQASSTVVGAFTTTGTNTFGGALNITGAITSTATTASTFPYASSTALSVSGTGYFGTASTTNLTVSSLTSGRVPYITTAGAFTDSSAFTFDGTTLTAANLTSSGNVSLGNATTTNLFSTTASSTNLFSTSASFSSLSVLGALTQTGLGTFANGFVSQASSTVVGAFTNTGAATFGSTLTASGLATLTSGFVSQASSTVVGAFTTTGTNTFGGALNIAGAITSTATSANTFPYASSTALSVSGTAYFGTASTTNLLVNSWATTTNLSVTGLTHSLLSTNALGQVVATTSIGSNLITGSLGTVNGTTFSRGNSITITAASSTLLANNNTFSGANTFTSAITSTAGTANTFPYASSTALSVSGTAYFGTASTTNLLVNSWATTTNLSVTGLTHSLLSTNALGQVVATTSIGSNLITGSLGTVNGTTFSRGNSITITAASSTLLANNNTFSGANTFTSAITSTAGTANTFPYASSTALTGTNIFSTTASTTNLTVSSIASGSILKTTTGGSVIAATAGTDFENVLTFSSPLSRIANTISIQNAAADGSTKGAASFTASDFDATTGNISLDYTNGQAASGSLKGFLTSADWTTFNTKLASSSISNSAMLAALLSDETGTGNVVLSASPTFTGTSIFANTSNSGTLGVTGLSTLTGGFVSQASSTVVGAFTTTGTNTFGGALNIAGAITSTATGASTFPYASSTALTVSGTGYFGTASTTNLTISGVPSSVLVTNSSGVVAAASAQTCTNQFIRSLSVAYVATCASVAPADLSNADFGDFTVSSGVASLDADTVSDSEIDYATVTLADFTNDADFVKWASATSTLWKSAGLLSTASSTIGDGTQTGGLTISGGATTTGNLIVQGSATSTFSNGISSTYLNITGTGATSTFASGINLSGGCLAVNGTCVGGGGSGATTGAANVFTALQTFSAGASTTQLSVFQKAYFGGTATSTFNSDGSLTMVAPITSTATSANTFPYASSTALTVSGTGYFGTASTSNLTVSSLTSGRVPFITTAGAFADSSAFTFSSSLSRLTVTNASTTAFSVSGNAYFPGSGIWNSSGSIGVGTTSPYAKFAVQATGGQINPVFQIASSSVGTSFFTVTSSGSVGIGTSAPVSPLHILHNEAWPELALTFDRPGAGATYVGLNTVDGADNQEFTFVAAGAAATTRGSLFALYGNEFTGSEGQVKFVAGTVGGGAGTDQKGAILFQTNDLTRMVILNNGYVGIGTTTPLRRFAVEQTASAAQFSVAYDTTRVTEIQTDSSGDAIINPSGDDVRLNDDNLWVCSGGSCPTGTPSGTGKLVVETALGVGTSTPVWPLTASHTTLPQLSLTDGSATSNAWTFRSIGNSLYIATSTASATSTQSAITITPFGRVGIGTTTPTTMLSVGGLLTVGASSTGQLATLGTATSTFNGDIKITGKLDVGTIDPVYTIGGIKYATYGHSTIGIKEETVQTIRLEKADDGSYAYTIDFDSLKKGSDLWLFYQITDFGKNWSALVVSLTPAFEGTVYYQKNIAENTLTIKSDKKGEVSMRLVGNRFDFSKWANLRSDQDGDTSGSHVIPEKQEAGSKK